MELVYYDLHIHSCLSPCGDDDMTPNNIANMALLKGLDLIALTDHNSCANGQALRGAVEQANRQWRQSGGDDVKPLLVLYGAEVETEEEVHCLCLFATLAQAQSFEQTLAPRMVPVKNRPDIYGNQWIMDQWDRVTGEEERLLAFAAQISFGDLFELTAELGGAFIPAHIDRPVYSVLSNLGFIPEDLAIAAVEVSPAGMQRGFLAEYPEIMQRYKVITSSDAHYLGDISERIRYMELPQRTEEAAVAWLRTRLHPSELRENTKNNENYGLID